MTLRDRQVFDDPGLGPQEAPPPQQRMLPIPWVAGGVVGIAVFVWLVDVLFLNHRLGLELALYGPNVALGQWWRTIGAVFVHAEPDFIRGGATSPISAGLTEGLLHIGFNMWVVVTLGFMFERSIGSARMLILSLIAALGASASSLYFNYGIVTVGASGMILGWAGALLPLATAQGRRQIGMWLVQIAVLSLLPGVSWAGHLGGFLFGLAGGAALRQRRAFWAIASALLAIAVLANAYAVQAHMPRVR